MSASKFKKSYKILQKEVDDYLERFWANSEGNDEIKEAALYSLSGGKRLRSLMIFGVAYYLGKTPRGLLDLCCSIEMVHAASLILDDLPCMDNSVVRRGREATYIKYGESVALLTTVSLLVSSSMMLIQAAEKSGLDVVKTRNLFLKFEKRTGHSGLVWGQMLDLGLATSKVSIHSMNDYKTGSLFTLAVEGSILLCTESLSDWPELLDYSCRFGCAYQLADDIIDNHTERYPETSLEEIRNSISEKLQQARSVLSKKYDIFLLAELTKLCELQFKQPAKVD